MAVTLLRRSGLVTVCQRNPREDENMYRESLEASLIVWAISEGRKMAAGINQYLQAGKSAKQTVK